MICFDNSINKAIRFGDLLATCLNNCPAGSKSAWELGTMFDCRNIKKNMVLVLLFVALWYIPRGDLFYVLPCVILFLCLFVLLALRLLRLGKRELIFVLFICLFDLRVCGFVYFLFFFVSGKGCGLCCGTPWTFLQPLMNKNKHQYLCIHKTGHVL